MIHLKNLAKLSASPLAFIFIVAGQSAFAGGGLLGSHPAAGGSRAPVAHYATYGGYGGGYVGGYGLYGGYYPFGSYSPAPATAGPNLPPNWWSGQGAGVDPRQSGYNPNAGYDWDSIDALLLSTSPPDARVTIDGTFVGSADQLGPMQLPMGKHTLRIEAPGYAPSETTLSVEHPGVQQLKIVLGRAPSADSASINP